MMNEESAESPDEKKEGWKEEPDERLGSRDLVRLLKPVIVRPERGKYVDPNEISSRFYNCFHYSLLLRDQANVNLAVGVTSANTGEGKTLVAANLAVSLAVANERETVLIDLNVRSPRVHRIFGVDLNPGLVEAFSESTIQVSQTAIKHLYVLPAGNISASPLVAEYTPPRKAIDSGEAKGPALGLEHVAAFRDVLYSLRQEYEFVVVDMPAIQEPPVPLPLIHQMDGILVVINANKTRHEDIQKMFRHINASQILGFVLNRAGNDLL